MIKHLKFFVLAFVLLFANSLVASAKDTFITVGSGGVTGVYYHSGGTLCRLMNRKRRQTNISCTVEATGGSIYNLNSLASSDGLDIVFAQDDWAIYSYLGQGVFAGKPNNNLRLLAELYSEYFTVIVKADSKIQTFTDIKGYKVNIGDPGAGHRATMERLMKILGWKTSDFRLVSELKASEQAQALCDNKIDVMIYSVGHPSGSLQEAVNSCKVRIIPVAGQYVEELIKEFPYYQVGVIDAKEMYGLEEVEISTFGVKASIYSSTKTSNAVAGEFVKTLVENFSTLKDSHPVYMDFQQDDLVNKKSLVPYHEGAIEYYKSKGMW